MPFSFLSPFFFLRFFFAFFGRSPFSPFLFVLSLRFVVFRLCLVSTFSLFFWIPCSPWWRILFFCLGDTPPPARCASLQVCVFPLCAAVFRAFLLFIIFYVSSLPSLFSISILNVVCFIFFFLCGYIYSGVCIIHIYLFILRRMGENKAILRRMGKSKA